MRLKRRRGATLGFVAIIVLVLIMIGVGFFVIAKMLGGGRELANSVDAGTLNVAKQALLKPEKAAREFPNPDVANNFELLSGDGKFRLENYNRLVVQAMIVALNAKDEGTPAAAANARKVWDAVNDVARFLRTNHQSAAAMGGHFQNLAAANNLKMMGQNGISMNGYEIAYTDRGKSTNVYFDQRIIGTFNSGTFPITPGSRRSPTGNQFIAGYAPLSVSLSNGTLVFSGVPVGPQDRPHLISGLAFDVGKDPAFMPGYPSELLPPNSFRSAGQTRESHTQTFGGAVASAIVGSLDREYPAGIPNGYIEIRNGPAFPTPQGSVAYTNSDIFSHALAGLGIDVTPNNTWFCRGSDNDRAIGDIKAYDTSMNTVPSDINAIMEGIINSNGQGSTERAMDAAIEVRDKLAAWPTKNLIDRWVDVNKMSSLAQTYLRRNNVPDCEKSLEYVRYGDGRRATSCTEFYAITDYTNCDCHWQHYSRDYRSMDIASRCVSLLPNFKRGYSQYGSSELKDNGSGFTCLEKFKTDVLIARADCVTCKTVRPDATPSGVKRFTHFMKYPAPLQAHNFGLVVTPYSLLEHIDTAPRSNGCAKGSTIDFLHKRCQQIKPSVTRDEVVSALRTANLPLNATLYLYVRNGALVMSDQRPPALIAGTAPDGLGGTPPTMNCGTPYNVIGNLVNTSSNEIEMLPNVSFDFFQNEKNRATKIAQHGVTDRQENTFSDLPVVSRFHKNVMGPSGSNAVSAADVPPYMTDRDPTTDGYFPGWSFRQAEPATCTDSAKWIPSSGYNNLLGQLLFNNECEGGGQFCQPN